MVLGEFSRLLAMEISDGPYFQVGKGGSFFISNTSAYEVKLLNAFFLCPVITFALLHYSQMGHFKILGCYFSLSVIQGGPGFPFFHPHVYEYLFSGMWSQTSIDLD